jgi:uncharacterized protein YndB with AHSA1/START domain
MPRSSEARALAPEEVLEITRTFDAPRELVFRLWSSPEHIARWWGPETCWLETIEMDFRECGAWRYWMRNGNGLDHWIGGTYRRIEPPGRLTFTYTNKYDGHEMDVDIVFKDIGGKTEMHFRQEAFRNVGERDGHREGWSSSLDLLAGYLAKLDRATVAPVGRPRREQEAPDIVAARNERSAWWNDRPGV